ncbi:hypothetical protein [Microbacterium sp.]|uniref:hypothetical protein n=1 Tax=Microbacterium sp. TaxID=51671 RepID=UPI0028112564|nr:hypothetical protein [Microbacterium sp.]
MRRLAIIPLLALGLLTGCSQVTQLAGEAAGVPVGEICAAFDDAYGQYQTLLADGNASEEQIAAARDDLVATLEGAADDIGGEIGDLISSNAQRLADSADLRAPETVEAVERVKESLDAFCG